MTGPASSTAISLLAVMKLKGVGRVKALQIVDRAMTETSSEGCRESLMSAMAAANPPRATVVVPLVARPLVAWITLTPACAHSKAAIVPAAPPPTINTSASWRSSAMFPAI